MSRDHLFALLLPGASLIIWELLARLLAVPRWILPPPSDIALTLARDRQLLLLHLFTTIQEVALGLVLSILLAILLAIGIVSSRLFEQTIYPLVVASQAIPIVALAPLLLIWFGYGQTPKVIVVVLICFFPIAVNLVDGLRGVDAELIDLLRSLGASRWQTLWVARIPAALPEFFSGLRVAAAVSVVAALIGEWVGSSAGLGYLMIRAASQFYTDRVFAAVLVSAVLSIALFWSVGLIERSALPWRTIPRSEQ